MAMRLYAAHHVRYYASELGHTADTTLHSANLQDVCAYGTRIRGRQDHQCVTRPGELPCEEPLPRHADESLRSCIGRH